MISFSCKIVLEELMLDLIKGRRIASHERDLERKRRMRQDESFGYSKKDKLTQWEKNVLDGILMPSGQQRRHRFDAA